MIIKTKGFVLRPIKVSDAKAYFECRNDKEARKGFLSALNSVSAAKKDLKGKIRSMKKRIPERELFAIEVDGKFAGFVDVHDLNEKYFKHRGTIGYCINKDYRGCGITTKAVKLVTDYAMRKYKLKRLEGWCRTFNKASARVLEKSGYKLEGILRKNKFKDGKYLDDMVWAKVK